MKKIVVLGDFIEDKNALQPLDTAIQSNLSESTTKILASLNTKRRESTKNEIWNWNEH